MLSASSFPHVALQEGPAHSLTSMDSTEELIMSSHLSPFEFIAQNKSVFKFEGPATLAGKHSCW